MDKRSSAYKEVLRLKKSLAGEQESVQLLKEVNINLRHEIANLQGRLRHASRLSLAVKAITFDFPAISILNTIRDISEEMSTNYEPQRQTQQTLEKTSKMGKIS